MTNALSVRRATPADAAPLLSLIRALADYEKLDPPDGAAQQRLIRDICGDQPRLDAFLAEIDGAPIGYALVFETYSSFLALPTLYLEDLFVLPAFRGRKAGSALFRLVIAEARRRGCGRMQWAALTWNKLAHDFYRRYGASPLEEWQTWRLTREQMDRISPSG